MVFVFQQFLSYAIHLKSGLTLANLEKNKFLEHLSSRLKTFLLEILMALLTISVDAVILQERQNDRLSGIA